MSLESLFESFFEEMKYLGITIIFFVITVVYFLTKGKEMDRMGSRARAATKELTAMGEAQNRLETKACDWCGESGYSGDKDDYVFSIRNEIMKKNFPYIYPVHRYTGFPENLPISSVPSGSELKQRIGIEIENFPSYLCEKCFNLAGGEPFFHRCKIAGYEGQEKRIIIQPEQPVEKDEKRESRPRFGLVRKKT